LILALAIAVASVFSSCASNRIGGSGCNMARGYVGYGASR
jgi:hypothetical protein